MTIVCPKCGTQNRIPEHSEPEARYRCGRCQTVLTALPQRSENRGDAGVARNAMGGKATIVVGILFLCLTLAGLAALAGWAIAEKYSISGRDTLDIVISPSSILRQIAQPVAVVGEEEQRLITLMTNTMEKADGSGISAPQVGLSQRIIVVNLQRTALQNEVVAMVNPQIVEREGSISVTEDCLSVSGETKGISVNRSEQIKVKYRTSDTGDEVEVEESGWNASVIQHQIDHLDGILITDYPKTLNLTPQVLVAALVLVAFLFIEIRFSF